MSRPLIVLCQNAINSPRNVYARVLKSPIGTNKDMARGSYLMRQFRPVNDDAVGRNVHFVCLLANLADAGNCESTRGRVERFAKVTLEREARWFYHVAEDNLTLASPRFGGLFARNTARITGPNLYGATDSMSPDKGSNPGGQEIRGCRQEYGKNQDEGRSAELHVKNHNTKGGLTDD